MKANELRIGNFVKDRNGRTIRVDYIEYDKVCTKNFKGGIEVHPFTEYFEYLEPILLTDEIMRDWCGFNYCVGIFSHEKIWSVLFIQAYHNGPFLLKTNAGDPIILIKYLHQLQNLYFALTGEELQIKIPFS